jgi:hypothetical protein
MLLDIPPEVLLLIISSFSIQELHTFELVSRLAHDLIQTHAASVYRAISIVHGMAPKDDGFEEVISKRKNRNDWLRGAANWKEFGEPSIMRGLCLDSQLVLCIVAVQRHFILEKSWKWGFCISKCGPFLHQGPHRLQVDDLEGTVITTRTTREATLYVLLSPQILNFCT